MKNHVLKTLVLFAILAWTLTGCDLFDSVGDVSINEPINASIIIDESNAGTDASYTQEGIIDATSNPEIEQYRNKFKSVSINRITFKVTDYSGEESITPFSAVSYSTTGESASNAIEIASLTNFNIQAAATSGAETELTVSDTDLQKIAAILKDDLAVKFYLTGTLTKTPVKFTVAFTVDTTIKAKALD